ncbi:hypothetical protein [Lentibacillus juripiscarius]
MERGIPEGVLLTMAGIEQFSPLPCSHIGKLLKKLAEIMERI